MTLKSSLLFFLVLVGSVHLSAQDPVVMRINGKDVLRSEFEYSFNKNNNGDIRSLKAIMDYVPMFVDYKLKVAAAEDAGYDTLTTFRNEFSMYRNQQIRPLIADQGFAEQKAIEYYNNLYAETEPDGMVKVAHILLRVGVNEPESKRIAIKNRADSIYQALLRGADFAQMARRYSQDAASAANGGELPAAGDVWGNIGLGMARRMIDERARKSKAGRCGGRGHKAETKAEDKADGKAHESYADFGDKAARNSSQIILKMLESR